MTGTHHDSSAQQSKEAARIRPDIDVRDECCQAVQKYHFTNKLHLLADRGGGHGLWYLRNRYARGRPLLRPVRQSANRRRAKPGNATRRRRAEHRPGPQTAAPAAPPGDHLGGRGHRGARGAGRHGLAGALATGAVPAGSVPSGSVKCRDSARAGVDRDGGAAADRRGSQCGARRGGLPAGRSVHGRQQDRQAATPAP